MDVGERVLAWLHSLPASERGASLVEYAFLAILIAMAALIALRFMGQQVNANLEDFNTEYGNLRNAVPAG